MQIPGLPESGLASAKNVFRSRAKSSRSCCSHRRFQIPDLPALAPLSIVSRQQRQLSLRQKTGPARQLITSDPNPIMSSDDGSRSCLHGSKRLLRHWSHRLLCITEPDRAALLAAAMPAAIDYIQSLNMDATQRAFFAQAAANKLKRTKRRKHKTRAVLRALITGQCELASEATAHLSLTHSRSRRYRA